MGNKITVFVALAIFLVLATFPFWYTLGAGRDVAPPELQVPQGQCIEPQMVARHMDLLDEWRNAVVRQGEKLYTATSGEQFEMSLTGTCLGCHRDRQAFCTKCHEYANVLPFRPAKTSDDGEPCPPGIRCWDCHIQPQDTVPQQTISQNTGPKGD